YEAAYRVALSRRSAGQAGEPVRDPLDELRTQIDAFDVDLDWAYEAGRRDAALGATTGLATGIAGKPSDQTRGGLAVAGGAPPTGGKT
ncbi:MAG TPA: hypothetical protein VFT95_03945, partial [Micromonosporaceae bacterium]|nr:hypothetical protein [Micromonosporaceae bacterium]